MTKLIKCKCINFCKNYFCFIKNKAIYFFTMFNKLKRKMCANEYITDFVQSKF